MLTMAPSPRSKSSEFDVIERIGQRVVIRKDSNKEASDV
jgi:hypothetical protein